MDRNQRILELASAAGELLLRSGAEIFRVQETMEKIAGAYHAPSFNVYVISNGIFTSICEGGPGYSTLIRHVPLSPVHLGRVAAVNELSRCIAEGKLSLEEAKARLEEIEKIPFKPKWLQVLASGIGSTCFCILFGGSLPDACASLIVGLLLWCVVLLAGRWKLSKIVTNIMASAAAAACGVLLYHLGLGQHMDKIIIGAVIPLVPGVALTTSVRDFFNSDYLSGTIHLIDAVLIAVCIALGVGGILKLADLMGFLV